VKALYSGARLGVFRLASGRSAFALGLAAFLVVLGALLERRVASLGAADRALSGIVFGIVIPLLAWGAIARATAARRLEDSVRELARHGADRRWSSAGLLLAPTAAVALLTALLAAFAVLLTRWPADPRLAPDLMTSSWVGLLAGAAYAGWFALGSTLGRSGGGRGVLLVLDWILGTGASLLALPWPRAHIKNLLGGEPLLGLPQWSATLALLVIGLFCGSAALLRTPR
jgi:hypothetical protein